MADQLLPALERLPDAVVVLDRTPDGWRAHLTRIGADSADPHDHPGLEPVPQAIRSILPGLAENGKVETVTFSDAHDRQWEGTFLRFPEPDGRGRVLGLLRAAERDRSAARQAVGEHQLYANVMAAFPNGSLVVFDHELRYRLIGGVSLDRLGLSAEEFLGKRIDERLAPERVAEIEPHLRAALAGERRVFELREDGLVFEVNAVPIPNPLDDAPGCLVISQDVTAYRKTEARLSALERRHDRMLKALPDVVYIFDPRSGRNLYITNRVNEQLGFTPAEVQGMGSDLIAQLVHPDDVENTRKYADEWEAIRDDRVRSTEFRMRHRDGSYRRLRSREVVLVRDPDGRPTQVLGVAEDITAQHQLEAQLLHSQRIEVLGQLVGGVAHDFNNILTAMFGNVELLQLELKQGRDPAQLEACADQLNAACQRAISLVAQLLLFSRREPDERFQVDVKGLLERTYQLLTSLLPETIQLTLAAPEECPSVIGDEHQLEQALINLAVNARDAMPNGGHLEILASVEQGPAQPAVTAVPDQQHVRITVRDTGRGMSPEVQQQAFEPFFTTKPAGQGTGLGLASVQAIVRRCGGRIELNSEVERGTEVVCRLPAVDGPAAQLQELERRPATETPETPDLSGDETILVCEDDDAVRRLTVAALTKLGYRVVPAANGEAALEHAADLGDALDLVVTDVIMPGLSGSALARELRQRRPDLPMIFVSGYTADQLQRSDLSGPRNVLVNKPFSSTTLAAHIRRMLDQPAPEGR